MLNDPVLAWPADDVHLAWIDADVVILNSRLDRYDSLVGGVGLIRPHQGDRVIVEMAAHLDPLISAGVLQRHPPLHPPRTAPAPERTLVVGAPPNLSRLPGVAATALLAGRAFDGADFSSLLTLARAMKLRVTAESARRQEPDEDQLRRHVTAFQHLLAWLPHQGVCLRRAFLLLHYLSRRGITADWVFGVRTWPFAAHCWLQIGTVALVDDVDRLEALTPILVV